MTAKNNKSRINNRSSRKTVKPSPSVPPKSVHEQQRAAIAGIQAKAMPSLTIDLTALSEPAILHLGQTLLTESSARRIQAITQRDASAASHSDEMMKQYKQLAAYAFTRCPVMAYSMMNAEKSIAAHVDGLIAKENGGLAAEKNGPASPENPHINIIQADSMEDALKALGNIIAGHSN